MYIRILISLSMILAVTMGLMHFNIPWDPVFCILLFGSLISPGVIFPIAGIIYFASWDHVLLDSFPFYSISGLIIFGSASWLSNSYPLARKPLSVIFPPVYSQFLWFMLMFGFYVSEKSSAMVFGYFAPFLTGNTLISAVLLFVYILLFSRDKRRDFSPELLAR